MCLRVWETKKSLAQEVRQTSYISDRRLPTTFKKKSVVRWDLEGPITSGYLAHCSHLFFMSIHIEFSASYSMLSQGLVMPTSLARLFINPELCQCPLRRSCQLSYFDTCSRLRASVLHQLVIGPVTVHLM